MPCRRQALLGLGFLKRYLLTLALMAVVMGWPCYSATTPSNALRNTCPCSSGKPSASEQKYTSAILAKRYNGHMRSWLVVVGIIIILVVALTVLSRPATPRLGVAPGVSPALPGQVLAARTKSAGCTVNGPLPDTACSPGAVITSATKDQICTPGYAKSVRNVYTEEKRQVYTEYGITRHQPGQFEVDHLVSLELGGSNDISNLWPEAANPTPGFHQKDTVENYLHDQVCRGGLPLAQAQSEIAGNWLAFYQTLAH